MKHIDQGAAFEAYQISWFDTSPMPGVPRVWFRNAGGARDLLVTW